MLKTIIGRPGSKVKIARHIIKVLRSFTWSVYVEPFCGSCAVYLKLLDEGIVEEITGRLSEERVKPIFVLNDQSYEIYNLFKVLREQPDELIRLVDLTPYSRHEHYLAQTIDRESVSDIERARMYLIDNRMSFSKQENCAWSVAKRHESTGCNKNSWTYFSTRLKPFLSALKSAYIECQDFEKVCRRFDSEHAIHYLDPPYFGKEHYYKEKFTEDNHLRLAKMAHELKGQVVISYYPVPEILELYPENKWERIYIETTMSVSNSNTHNGGNREKRTEMILVRK